MKFRGLIIAVVVLLALCGLLYWSNHRKPSGQSVSALPSSASPAILKMDRAAISAVSLTRKGGAPVTLEKGAGDAWKIAGAKPLDADQEAVSSLLATVSDLNADRVVEDKASDLKQYGLDQPSVIATITGKDHLQRKLLVGDNTPAGGDAYAMVEGDPKVYTIASYNKTSIDKGPDDFRNKKLFQFGFQDPDRIDIREGTKSWTFTRNGADWQSDGKKLDSAGMESLIEKLRDLTATGFPESGFTAPVFEATVTSDDGKRLEKVHVSKSGTNYIARRDGDASLYELDSSAATALISAPDTIKPAK